MPNKLTNWQGSLYLIFVGGIEWNFTDFLVLLSVADHVTNWHFNTLQQSWLRRVAITLSVHIHTVHSRPTISSSIRRPISRVYQFITQECRASRKNSLEASCPPRVSCWILQRIKQLKMLEFDHLHDMHHSNNRPVSWDYCCLYHFDCRSVSSQNIQRDGQTDTGRKTGRQTDLRRTGLCSSPCLNSARLHNMAMRDNAIHVGEFLS